MKIFTRIFTLTAVMLLVLCPAAFAADAQTLYNTEYCFSESDFEAEQTISGIFVTGVPQEDVAGVFLGDRAIRSGDVLPADALGALRLVPACRENCEAAFSYQPIYGTVLGEKTQLTVHIRSGKNETPKAIGAEFETYKNIANDGQLTGSDPENAPLTFQLVEAPKRGKVQLAEDGTYVYTPDKNKVGEDKFTFTVTDEAGNVSKPATVNIQILKPSQAMTFADMEGSRDTFEAVWMCDNALTSGRSICGTPCFCPDETVSRAEFLMMAMKLGGCRIDDALTVSGFADAQEAPAWIQPYLAAAMRQGLIRGEVTEAGLIFRPNDAITGREAAVILQNMLQLPVSAAFYPSEYAWSAAAVQALSEVGLCPQNLDGKLTRLDTAKLFYQVAQLKG